MKKYCVMMVISILTLLSFSAHVQASYNALSISEVKTLIIEQAEKQQVSPALALAIAKVESDFNPLATSSAGARGVMQILPKTGEDVFGVSRDRLYHAPTNIELGLSFIKQLLAKYDQRLDIALSHYNGGSAVQGENGNLYVIPSTQGYVNKVLSYYRQFDIKPYYSPFHHAKNQHTARSKEYPYKVGEIHNAIYQQKVAEQKTAQLVLNEPKKAPLTVHSNKSQGISIKGPKKKVVQPSVINHAGLNSQYVSTSSYEQGNVQVQAYPQVQRFNSVVSWHDVEPVKPVIKTQRRRNTSVPNSTSERSYTEAYAGNTYTNNHSTHENKIVTNYLQGKTTSERKTQVRQWESIFK